MRPAQVTIGSLICAFCLLISPLSAQEDRPGRSIGKVSTLGNLILMELDDGALGQANLFDLAGRTLRFVRSTRATQFNFLRWSGIPTSAQNSPAPMSLFTT